MEYDLNLNHLLDYFSLSNTHFLSTSHKKKIKFPKNTKSVRHNMLTHCNACYKCIYIHFYQYLKYQHL